MTDRPIRWLLHIVRKEGGQAYKGKDELHFPHYEALHPTRDACEGEAMRVLNVLCDRGDDRDWKAHIAMNPLDLPERGVGVSNPVYTIRHGDYAHICQGENDRRRRIQRRDP